MSRKVLLNEVNYQGSQRNKKHFILFPNEKRFYSDENLVEKSVGEQDKTQKFSPSFNNIILIKIQKCTLCYRRIDTFLKRLFLCHKHAKTTIYVFLACL